MEVQRKRCRSIGGEHSVLSKRKRTLAGARSSPAAAAAAVAAATAALSPAGSSPSRFMFYEKGAWNDFPNDACESLRQGFAAGKDAVRLILSSCVYIVSFVQMLQIHIETGYARSIAWVDDLGELRSPVAPFEGNKKKDKDPSPAALSARKASGTDLSSPEVGEVVDDGQEPKRCTAMRKLGPGDRAYAEVKRSFLGGLGVFSAAAEVTGVYEVAYAGAAGVARKESFEARSELTERVRGRANLQLAWYGCSKQELCMIIQHGFGRPTRDSSFGLGVYLSPEKHSRLSCVGADVDENGEQLVLLCQVILGNSELVQPGSVQCHPSSEQFDTGVDNLSEPKKLIVWSTHMNTHILPIFVTSFKLPKEWHELMEASAANKPSLALDKPKGADKASTIPKLFEVLKPELSSVDMAVLQSDYLDHKNGKISREEFLKRVRSTAGDETLRKLVQRSGLFKNKCVELSSKRSTIAR